VRRPPSPARLLDEALRLAGRAAGRVLDDPRGREAVARAVGLAQRSLQRVERAQARLMEVAGVPGRRDFEALARSLARVKVKARRLEAALRARQEPPAGEGGEGGPGRGGGGAPEP
jgi:hypothetical protein